MYCIYKNLAVDTSSIVRYTEDVHYWEQSLRRFHCIPCSVLYIHPFTQQMKTYLTCLYKVGKGRYDNNQVKDTSAGTFLNST